MSPWPSPSTLSLRTRRGPLTGSLKTPVNTVFPCQGTALGMPTLTDRSVPAAPPPAACWGGALICRPKEVHGRVRGALAEPQNRYLDKYNGEPDDHIAPTTRVST